VRGFQTTRWPQLCKASHAFHPHGHRKLNAEMIPTTPADAICSSSCALADVLNQMRSIHLRDWPRQIAMSSISGHLAVIPRLGSLPFSTIQRAEIFLWRRSSSPHSRTASPPSAQGAAAKRQPPLLPS